MCQRILCLASECIDLSNSWTHEFSHGASLFQICLVLSAGAEVTETHYNTVVTQCDTQALLFFLKHSPLYPSNKKSAVYKVVKSRSYTMIARLTSLVVSSVSSLQESSNGNKLETIQIRAYSSTLIVALQKELISFLNTLQQRSQGWRWAFVADKREMISEHHSR